MARERVHVNIWEIFSCRYGVFIDVIWMCGERRYDVIYVAHRGGSINGGSWLERERGVCYVVHTILTKKMFCDEKNKEESSKNEVLLG